MSIQDSLILAGEYEYDIDWVVEKISKQYRLMQIVKQLELGEIVSNSILVGSKKGNAVYNKWRSAMKMKITEIEKEKRIVTVFDRLHQEKKSNTIFDRLKRMHNGI